MTAEIETTPIEVRNNAYWPDEALLIAFAEQDDREEQAEQPVEDSAEYAVLYFVS